MVDYKDTKRYSQVPNSPTSVYVGVPGQTDHSGKSTRVDDNFTNIAQNIGNGQAYLPGDGIDITSNVVSLKYDDNTLKLNGNGVLYVPTISYLNLSDKLVAGNANVTIEGNVISTENTTYEEATTLVAGLMSAEDKYKLDQLNTFTLPTASTTELGGVKIDDSTIKITPDGTIYAVLQDYPTATSSSAGLMSPVDKEKLNTVHVAANYIYAGTENGKLSVNETINGITVYTHPAYEPITINTSGKILNGITVDRTGHVTSATYTNVSSITGVNISDTDLGDVITNLSVDQYTPNTIEVSRTNLSELTLGSVDTTTSATSYPVATDSLQTAIKKVWNNSNTRLIYKGTVGSGGTVDHLPAVPADGDMYKVISTISVDGSDAVNGDLVIYYADLGGWTVVQSGSRPDGNTWRPIKVDHVEKKDGSSSSGYIDFAGGTNIGLSYSNGVITINYTGGETAGEYIGGTGISVGVDQETGDNVINLKAASTSLNEVGGVMIGSRNTTNIYIDPNGYLHADDTTYSGSSGISIVGTTISPIYGTDAHQIAEGNHSHNLGDLEDVTFATGVQIPINNVLRWNGTYWTNSPDSGQPIYVNDSPLSSTKIINFVGDNTNIVVDADDTSTTSTVTISYIGNAGAYDAGDGLDLDNDIFSIKLDSQTGSNDLVLSSDGLYYSLPTAGDASVSGTTPVKGGVIVDGTSITINSLGVISATGGSSTGGTYSELAPITVDNTLNKIGLAYDTNTLGVSSGALVAYGRAVSVQESASVTKSIGTNALKLVGGSNVTLSVNTDTANSLSTVTIDSTGSSSNVGNLYDLDDVSIPHSGSSVPTDGYILKYHSGSGGIYGYWSPEPDINTTYTGGTGISVSNTSDANIKSLSIKQKSTYSGLEFGGSGNDELGVKVDGTSISINSNNALQVSLSSAEVSDSNSSIDYTQTNAKLENNTIYKFTSDAITSIDLDAESTMSYCTLWFTTSSTVPTWNIPLNWRCVGHNCSGGSFSPVANSEYEIAIDVLTGRTTLYVLKLT